MATKNEYKLDTGLWCVSSLLAACGKDEEFMFETDEEAWNTLRKRLPGKYATLFRWETVSVPINNPKELIPMFNKKYKQQQIDVDSQYRKSGMWVPVLFGVTDDEYKVENK